MHGPRANDQWENGVNIRLATATELDALDAVIRSSDELFRGTHLEWALDEEISEAFRFNRALGEGTLWVAEVDGQLAGLVCAHATETSLYVDQLSVAKAFQGRGIGRALMRHAIAHARTAFPAISLITDREIPWNAPFYASLGFVEWSEPDPGVQADLDEEIADGFDPATRIVMIIEFG